MSEDPSRGLKGFYPRIGTNGLGKHGRSVLALFEHRNEPLDTATISHVLGIPPSILLKSLKGLERRGLIERVEASHRRSIIWRLKEYQPPQWMEK